MGDYLKNINNGPRLLFLQKSQYKHLRWLESLKELSRSTYYCYQYVYIMTEPQASSFITLLIVPAAESHVFCTFHPLSAGVSKCYAIKLILFYYFSVNKIKNKFIWRSSISTNRTTNPWIFGTLLCKNLICSCFFPSSQKPIVWIGKVSLEVAAL